MEMKSRVVGAAEAALADQQYVSAIDVLIRIGLLAATHAESWRKGRIDILEGTIQANPSKVSHAMALFHEWALENGLKPSETRYVRTTRNGTVDLQFSLSGDPAIEKKYRTHYLSPGLSERKQERLTQKLSSPAQPVVFEIVRDSACSECGAELEEGSFLLMEAEQPLCLPCARLGDLEYLPAGDAALTRRATKYSERTAVVVRFSRSRGRYERQGILVEPSALGKAEQECSEDASERAKARAAGAARRQQEDRELGRPDDGGNRKAISPLSPQRGRRNRGAHRRPQQRPRRAIGSGSETGCGCSHGRSNRGGPSSPHGLRCVARGRKGPFFRQREDRGSGPGDSGRLAVDFHDL